MLFQGSQPRERQPRVNFLLRPRHGRKDGLSITAHMRHERGARAGVLKPAAEHNGTRILTEGAILSVFHHADDFIGVPLAWLSLEQMAPHRSLAGPALFRQGPLDDCHLRKTFPVARVELAALQQRGYQSCKVARAHIERLKRKTVWIGRRFTP